MADVNTGDGGGHGRHQKKRAKKLPTKIDMTPMVDLGFLLLTFFMLATTFSKPKVIELTPPAKTKDTSVFKKVKEALTIILSANNKVYYYNGELNNGEKVLTSDSNNMQLTNFGDDGIRKIILQRNSLVIDALKPLNAAHDNTNNKMSDTAYERQKQFIQGDPKALFVIIKTDSAAKYVNVVSMLDEMNICSVDKYALVDVSQSELLMMKDYNIKHQIR